MSVFLCADLHGFLQMQGDIVNVVKYSRNVWQHVAISLPEAKYDWLKLQRYATSCL